MMRLKEAFLWLVIIVAFTPLAFILMPFIVIAGIIGSLGTLVDNLFHRKMEVQV